MDRTAAHIHTIPTFLAERLPELLSRKEKLRVVISTYNGVENFLSGNVESDDPDLSILIQSGEFMSLAPMGFFAGAMKDGYTLDSFVAVDRKVAEQVQADIEAKTLQGSVDSASPCLAFIYYGVNAGDRPLKTAISLHRKFGATVVLVACDCKYDHKESVARQQIEAGNISDLVFGRKCGGRLDLQFILMTIKTIWKDRSR